MPEQEINGVRLYHEQHGSGPPVVCIHGAGGTALAWAGAVEKLARRGRVIAYDRRGCARSERPQPYERTSVTEHADDAAALLDALAATPAIVIGRSYGGTVAADLALRYPDRVRALVLLEPDASRELAPAAAAWVDAVRERLRQVAAENGVDAVVEALVGEVAGRDAWRSFPADVRRMVRGNGPALLAELAGRWWLEADAAALSTIEQPALLVMAADSPPEFHQASRALADALPNARTSVVGGGHLIDPAAPEVLAFVDEVLLAGPGRGVVLSGQRDATAARPHAGPALGLARSVGAAMKTTRLPATLVAVALALLAAPVARADVDQPAPGVAAAQSGPKDYSKNAATGDYRILDADEIHTSSLAGTTSATSSPVRASAPGARFSWGDAGLGAAAGFALALGGAACAVAIRRRARPAHS